VCVLEELLVRNTIRDTWNEATRVKNSAGAAAASIGEEVIPAEVIPTVVATSAENQLPPPRLQDKRKKQRKVWWRWTERLHGSEMLRQKVSHQSDPFKYHSILAR